MQTIQFKFNHVQSEPQPFCQTNSDNPMQTMCIYGLIPAQEQGALRNTEMDENIRKSDPDKSGVGSWRVELRPELLGRRQEQEELEARHCSSSFLPALLWRQDRALEEKTKPKAGGKSELFYSTLNLSFGGNTRARAGGKSRLWRQERPRALQPLSTCTSKHQPIIGCRCVKHCINSTIC